MVTLFAMQYINILTEIDHILMSIHVKEKTVTVSTRKDAIPNIDVKVWNRKSELPQGIFPMFLNTP